MHTKASVTSRRGMGRSPLAQARGSWLGPSLLAGIRWAGFGLAVATFLLVLACGAVDKSYLYWMDRSVMILSVSAGHAALLTLGWWLLRPMPNQSRLCMVALTCLWIQTASWFTIYVYIFAFGIDPAPAGYVTTDPPGAPALALWIASWSMTVVGPLGAILACMACRRPWVMLGAQLSPLFLLVLMLG